MANRLALAGSNSRWQLSGKPAGFFAGVWHGLWSPVTVFISLLTPEVSFFELNRKRRYTVAFLLTVGSFYFSLDFVGESLLFWIALAVFALQAANVVKENRVQRRYNAELATANKDLTRLNRELQLKSGQLEQANHEIQEATRLKSEFLSRMSHDLRTPMNAIIGYTRILRRRLEGTIEERQYGNLENIQTSADNLLSLINEILDLSRIEAGRISIRPEPVDLGQLVGECIISVAPLTKPGVELVQEIGEVGPANTDADRLRRVVMNLLGNAVKFTEEGRITVSLKPVDSGIELSVADTGVGIPAEDLPHIFEEFRQVERQVGEKTEGTGLGLAIAAKSVEMLGGTISAESEVGKGTTFTVRIGDFA